MSSSLKANTLQRAAANAVAARESHIQQTCTQMLELDGWRALKTDPVSDRERAKGFGEWGMADHLYIRYAAFAPPYIQNPGRFPLAHVMWIEFKRVRAGRVASTKLSEHQNDWHTLERKRGALMLKAGVDFPATIEGFKTWYIASGLMRNKIL